MAGADSLALVDVVLVGFVRIVTNPQIFADPAPTADATRFVDAVRVARKSRWLPPTTAAWEQFCALSAGDERIRGNLVPDAWLAALATVHGCRLATADRGFARFPDLDWFTPA